EGPADEAEPAPDVEQGPVDDPRRPAGKGRPTPKRRDQERARGMHTGAVTAPVTRKEARQRRKTAEASMWKDERRAARAKDREAREGRRQLMMEGDERYVVSRERCAVGLL